MGWESRVRHPVSVPVTTYDIVTAYRTTTGRVATGSLNAGDVQEGALTTGP